MSDATRPLVFDEFFDSGLEESVSPFLTPSSRSWGKNLPLKASILAAILLAVAFAFSFTHPVLSSLLLLFVYFFAGIPKLIAALEDILNLEINIDVLMTLAAFLSVLIGSALEGGLLLVLFALSGAMEDAVTSKAKSALHSLRQLSPTKVYLVGADGHLIEKHIRDVTRGASILVRSGEVVPLDGVITRGASSVDLSHLTGESLPEQRVVGDKVPAGATNLEGAITLEVTHTSSDSTLARIIELITQAHEAKPRFQRWLDQVGRRYSISIILLSFLFAVTLPLFLNLPYFGDMGSVYRALAFLIAASPCALIIALPVAYLSSISACARSGILLKGGITLDALASCRAVAFDKTGTLTSGKLECLGIDTLRQEDAVATNEALSVALSLELNAVHPIATAIVNHAKQLGTPKAPLHSFRAIPGYGLEGFSEKTYTYIGHPSYLEKHLPPPVLSQISRKMDEIRQQGELVSVMLFGERIFLFRFEDRPRPGISEALAELKEEHHLKLLMLTGDHHANAKAVADRIGIDKFYADLRPEDKLKYVTDLSQHEGLAMVGDGINDAPALARATCGVSMGQVGSRTAVDASDAVLLHDDIHLLSWLFTKAKLTQQIIRQNVALATLAIIGASISALLGLIPLWLAVLLHEGGTVIVGLNSLRLLSQKRKSDTRG